MSDPKKAAWQEFVDSIESLVAGVAGDTKRPRSEATAVDLDTRLGRLERQFEELAFIRKIEAADAEVSWNRFHKLEDQFKKFGSEHCHAINEMLSEHEYVHHGVGHVQTMTGDANVLKAKDTVPEGRGFVASATPSGGETPSSVEQSTRFGLWRPMSDASLEMMREVEPEAYARIKGLDKWQFRVGDKFECDQEGHAWATRIVTAVDHGRDWVTTFDPDTGRAFFNVSMKWYRDHGRDFERGDRVTNGVPTVPPEQSDGQKWIWQEGDTFNYDGSPRTVKQFNGELFGFLDLCRCNRVTWYDHRPDRITDRKHPRNPE